MITPSALRELLKLPNKDVAKISETITQLADNPTPRGCKKLKSFDNLWRVRTGNYRVIYSIKDEVLSVEILKVKDRKDAY